MLSAADAVHGATSPPSAQRQILGAPSAERSTRHPTIGAWSRGARPGGATHAHVWWPDAETVQDHTSPRPTCA